MPHLHEPCSRVRRVAMITSFSRRLVFAGSVIVLCLMGGMRPVTAQDEAPQEESVERAPVNPKVLEFVKPIADDDNDDELARKMKERHNVAVKLLDTRVEEYRRNIGNLALVLDAARLVIDAKLDLAMDRDEQLAIFESALEVARLIEQHYQSLSDAGIGTSSELQRAKLARVTVEVQILKLKRQP